MLYFDLLKKPGGGKQPSITEVCSEFYGKLKGNKRWRLKVENIKFSYLVAKRQKLMSAVYGITYGRFYMYLKL